MIQTKELVNLAGKWTERMKSSLQPTAYKDALSDCIYELGQLIAPSILEEIPNEEIQEYLDSLEADYYADLEET